MQRCQVPSAAKSVGLSLLFSLRQFNFYACEGPIALPLKDCGDNRFEGIHRAPLIILRLIKLAGVAQALLILFPLTKAGRCVVFSCAH